MVGWSAWHDLLSSKNCRVGLYMRVCDFSFFSNTAAAAVQHSAGIKTTLFLFTFPSQMKLIRADILSQNSTGTSAPRSARQSRLPPFGTMLVIPPGAPRHISEEPPEVALCLAPWRIHICPFYDGSCVKLHWNGVDKPFFPNMTCADTLKHDRSTKVKQKLSK